MKNIKFFGLLIVSALVLLPETVLADTGSTGSLYQAPTNTYNNSLSTSYRQTVGTSRLITTKSATQPQTSSTFGVSTSNSSAFHRPGAFRYRNGYKRMAPSRRVKKHGIGLPGHKPSASVPELDSSVSQSALFLLIGTVFVLRSRRRRDTESK